MQPLSAVLFDWDGTVADTRPGIFNSIRYAIGKFGIPDRPDEELEYFIGPPLYGGFGHVFGAPEELAVQLTDTYRVYYREKGIFECSLYEGVGSLLRELRASGVKTAVVSSKPKVFLDQLVEYLDLEDAFDAVVGPELDNHVSDKSSLVEAALTELGVSPEEAAMVGDRKFDMEGAKTVGVLAVGILFGFGSEEELCRAGADVICEQVVDLRGFLKDHCKTS